MRWHRPDWKWLLTGLLALSLGLLAIGPRWTVATISRMRYSTPLAVADSFLMAATQGDSATLWLLSADSTAPTHVRALFEREPALRRASESRKLYSAGRVHGRPERVAITYFVPSRVKDTFCYLPGSTDHLEVTTSFSEESWKVVYAGLDPC